MCRYTIYHTYLLMYILSTLHVQGFSGGPESKESACNAGDMGSVPGLGRSGEGNGHPLWYSCLENSGA